MPYSSEKEIELSWRLPVALAMPCELDTRADLTFLPGGMDFASMKHVLSEAVVTADGTIEKPENAVRYGAWINTIINLIIVGFVLFIMVRAYNKTKAPVAEAAPAGPSDNDLLGEIRDLLKK